MIFNFFSLFFGCFPTPTSTPPKTTDQGLPRRGSCGALVFPSNPTPIPASRAGLCQRLNQRLRPLDARPVTSPIHKTGTGCQAGAARAVAMETTNGAPRAPLNLRPASHLRTLGRAGGGGGGAGNAFLVGAVAGQGLPYLPAPHLESSRQAHSLSLLGGFFAAPLSIPRSPSSLEKEARVSIASLRLGEFS